MSRIRRWGRRLWREIRLGGLSIVKGTVDFYQSENLTFAASIAYYSLLSLFPFLLLAPKAGSELRGQLGDQASRLRDRASEGYSAASTKVSSMYNRASGTATANPPAAGSMGTSPSGFPSGTSGYSTSGPDTPATSSEF